MSVSLNHFTLDRESDICTLQMRVQSYLKNEVNNEWVIKTFSIQLFDLY